MDTNRKMDLMICEQALVKYSAIEAAIERGSGGFAKDTLKDLKSLLANQTQHSAFRSANASLPRPSTKSYEWKSELAYSRGYIEKYLCELRADLEAEAGKSTFQPNDF